MSMSATQWQNNRWFQRSQADPHFHNKAQKYDIVKQISRHFDHDTGLKFSSLEGFHVFDWTFQDFLNFEVEIYNNTIKKNFELIWTVVDFQRDTQVAN